MLNFSLISKRTVTLLAALGLSVLGSACVAGPDVDLDQLSAPYEPMDPYGGQNGADSYDYHYMWDAQQAAMRMPLTEGSLLVREEIKALGLPTSVQGEEIFPYLIRCGLPIGAYVSSPTASQPTYPYVDFQGEGIMNLEHDWREAALPAQDQERLQECVMALLNPEGTREIRFQGEHVQGDASIKGWRMEGVWLAIENYKNSGQWLRRVYVRHPEGDWQGRICADLDEGCGIEIVFGDAAFERDCREISPGSYSCLDHSTITSYVQ